jgi:hypothetical protein
MIRGGRHHGYWRVRTSKETDVISLDRVRAIKTYDVDHRASQALSLKFYLRGCNTCVPTGMYSDGSDIRQSELVDQGVLAVASAVASAVAVVFGSPLIAP